MIICDLFLLKKCNYLFKDPDNISDDSWLYLQIVAATSLFIVCKCDSSKPVSHLGFAKFFANEEKTAKLILWTEQAIFKALDYQLTIDT